ncbi:hypothetical protein CONCODRAFT_20387 [Conidiobolus coronatus NRRL 28638]|uniref:Uncharacterized protein n=1 Tax=Conidiobolus coronatus (strain ATCC 28846 / CBS 209.66 / NRRL 28638) TaxID=796925 RepID=A0A137NTV2_CONC2|nr:hypothetical protein CONCODRAFT_20387 [Conidiobolus coronatus NRRL 28638]|eukprot:KXN66151.1 hypothetical protein CONCODRAFT_20387 [Conidiobolus coronatus NRRL 28638]
MADLLRTAQEVEEFNKLNYSIIRNNIDKRNKQPRALSSKLSQLATNPIPNDEKKKAVTSLGENNTLSVTKTFLLDLPAPCTPKVFPKIKPKSNKIVNI